ncbi:MAG: hypothetical protein E6J00_06790 [Chloroflexi bacterium]|nr:MAG: hypothetical protein E6J00_06790 [Chloroflexota bacterium]
MMHLDDGTLRRMQDEPLAISGVQQLHYDRCQDCQQRRARIATQAGSVERLLRTPALEPRAEAAFGRLMAGIQRAGAPRPLRWYQRWSGPGTAYARRLTRPALAVAVAAALLVGFTGYEVAPRLLTVFHPTRVAPVRVSASDLRAGQTLDYGTLTWTPAPPRMEQAASLAQAARRAGLPALTPGALPAAVGTTVSYATLGQATASYQFDSRKLARSAQSQGLHAAAMPAAVDGSVLVIDSGPSLVQVYGPLPEASGASPGSSAERPGLSESLPRLLIGETRAPTVTSTGASARQLEDYLLSQPGVPADIAAQVRAIQDPTSTLLVPVPSGLATSRTVRVQGVDGLLVDAGIGAGVVWQKGGIIYAVLGQLTPDQILQIAASLH